MSKKTATTPRLNGRIDKLISFANFQAMYVEQLNDREKLLIVPMRESYENIHTNSKATKPLQYLLITQNDKGQIRRSDIMLFYPKDATLKVLPKNSFHDFFYFEQVSVDGTMAMLSLDERFRYEMKFEEGEKVSFKNWQTKDDDLTVSRTGSNCTYWYLVTTYYENNVIVNQTWEYIGETCVNPCSEGSNCETVDYLPEGEGGGGEPSIPVAVAVSRNFLVYAYHQGFENWDIVSFHNISGFRDDDQPANNTITSINYVVTGGTDYNPAQCYESTSSCHKVYQNVGTVVGNSPSTATATSNNIVTYPNRDNDVRVCNKSFIWQAETVFQ